jgi:hypothetical protein
MRTVAARSIVAMLLSALVVGCVSESDPILEGGQADEGAPLDPASVVCAAARVFPATKKVEPIPLEVRKDDVGNEFERITHQITREAQETFPYAITASLPTARDEVGVIFRDLKTEVGAGAEGTFNGNGEFLFVEDQIKPEGQEFVFVKCCRGTKECDPIK